MSSRASLGRLVLLIFLAGGCAANPTPQMPGADGAVDSGSIDSAIAASDAGSPDAGVLNDSAVVVVDAETDASMSPWPGVVPGVAARGTPPDSAARAELVSSGMTQHHFTDVARVNTDVAGACSGYDRMDNCYNSVNPETPSIVRRLSRPAVPSNGDGVSFPRVGDWPYEHEVGATAIEVQRTTTDGRLGFTGSGTYSTFEVVLSRPEVVDYDVRTTATPQVQYPGAQIHPLMWLNPLATAFPLHNLAPNGDRPDSLHNMACDGSQSAYVMEDGSSPKRNPVACRARAEDGAPYLDGDCYDISLFVSATGLGHWEFRSVDFTIFVQALRTQSVGEGGNVVWIYPRRPRGTSVDGGGIVTLPSWAPFDMNARLNEINYNGRSIQSWIMDNTTSFTSEWQTIFTTVAGAQCFTSAGGGNVVVNTSGPAWCQYFETQARSSTFTIDDNRNSTIDDAAHSTSWDGTSSRPWTIFEPTITADGKLLVTNGPNGLSYSVNSVGACRADGWSHFLPITHMPHDPAMAPYGLANSQYLPGGDYHTARPFRDALGNDIPFGAIVRFAYPWMDRRGRNLFFASGGTSRDGWYASSGQGYFGNDSTHELPILASTPYQAAELGVGDGVDSHLNPDAVGPGKYVAALGAWTHGRMVVMDNGLTPAAFGGITRTDGIAGGGKSAWDNHVWGVELNLDIYANDSLRMRHKGLQTMFSYENELNHIDAMRPTAPYDVVWRMLADTARAAEITFDDYISLETFVAAPMNSPVRVCDNDMSKGYGSGTCTTNVHPGEPASRVTYEDGFAVQPSSSWSGDSQYFFDARYGHGRHPNFLFAKNPLLQNTATGEGIGALTPPRYLRLRGGARVEPVALGGVQGAGVFLDGDNDFVDMHFPRNDAYRTRPWYFGLWIDPRKLALPTGGDTLRAEVLFYFSDDSWIGVARAADGTTQLAAYDGATSQMQTLPVATGLIQNGSFVHIGAVVHDNSADGTRHLSFFIDGTPHGELVFDNGGMGLGFDLMASDSGGASWFLIGDAPGSRNRTPGGVERVTFRGWIDELRIRPLPATADPTSDYTSEIICNDALGTIVDISTHDGEPPANMLDQRLYALRARALLYPGVPRTVCEQLVIEGYTDRTDYAPQRGRTLCAGTVHHSPLHEEDYLQDRCLRGYRLGNAPPNNLRAMAPRPNFSTTAFCLSCHSPTQPFHTMAISPTLTSSSTLRYMDFRRQPLDVPAVLSGSLWTTGGVYGSIATNGVISPSGGYSLDQTFDEAMPLISPF